MQSDRFVVAGQWLNAAAADVRIARLLRNEEPPGSCFHAQQAAEKALKAAAVAIAGDAARSHALALLLDALSAGGVIAPDPVVRAAQILERYYAPTRYPDAIGGIDPGRIFTVEDAQEAIVHAEAIMAFAADVITERKTGG